MTKEQRLAAVLAGTPLQDQAAALAALPGDEVDRIVRVATATRRAGRADEKAIRAQRHRDRRAYGWTEGPRLLKAVRQLVTGSLVSKAALDLDTLAGLDQHYKAGRAVLARAVAGARNNDYSDEQIAQALGVTRQAVERRFPRTQPVTPAGT